MIVLGFDTSTSATAVGLRLHDGSTLQARDDPGPGEHPGHATRLLPLADELLAGAGLGWSALERIAAGVGPGTFTGLRVGVATARGLAQSLGIDLVGVSSLRALAEPALGSEPGARRVLAVLDARRGEVFVAAYEMTDRGPEERVAPVALAPEGLCDVVEPAQRWEAIGDGAVRFRGDLESAAVTVPPDSSPLHLLSAEAICALGARAQAVAIDRAIVPDYRRRPDAEIALERKRAVAAARTTGDRSAGDNGRPGEGGRPGGGGETRSSAQSRDGGQALDSEQAREGTRP
jgi:tRNA threonylcarbamoyladenosine biosynthesis protein TsaB